MGKKYKTTKAWWPAVRRYLQNRSDLGLPAVTTETIIAETYMIGSETTASSEKRLCQSRMCPTRRELTRWLNTRNNIIAVKGTQRQAIAWVIEDEN